MGHYVDGLRAPLILRAKPPVKKDYDEEVIVSVADWYNSEHSELISTFLSKYNPSGIEPVPDSGLVLINQTIDAPIKFTPGKKYRLRIINMSAFAMFRISIDGHDMQVIEVDGIDTKPLIVNTLSISAAQRYSVIVTALNTTSFNYQMHADMDTSMFNTFPPSLVTSLLPLTPRPHHSYSLWKCNILSPILFKPVDRPSRYRSRAACRQAATCTH